MGFILRALSILLLLVLATGAVVLCARRLVHFLQLESYQLPGYFRSVRRNAAQALAPGRYPRGGGLSLPSADKPDRTLCTLSMEPAAGMAGCDPGGRTAEPLDAAWKSQKAARLNAAREAAVRHPRGGDVHPLRPLRGAFEPGGYRRAAGAAAPDRGAGGDDRRAGRAAYQHGLLPRRTAKAGCKAGPDPHRHHGQLRQDEHQVFARNDPVGALQRAGDAFKL